MKELLFQGSSTWEVHLHRVLLGQESARLGAVEALFRDEFRHWHAVRRRRYEG